MTVLLRPWVRDRNAAMSAGSGPSSPAFCSISMPALGFLLNSATPSASLTFWERLRESSSLTPLVPAAAGAGESPAGQERAWRGLSQPLLKAFGDAFSR